MLDINQVKDRPAVIRQKIAMTFSEISKPEGENKYGFVFTGHLGHYTFKSHGLTFDTKTLLEELLSKTTAEKIEVLDIGTGAGNFILAANQLDKKIQTTGITAVSFLSEKSALTIDENYLIYNAEELFSHPKIQEMQFDCIVSHATFMHFVDPMGALILAYAALKQDGLLLVDEFSISGLEQHYPSFISYLEKQGYQIIADYNDVAFTSFVIKKTLPHLVLPLTYMEEIKEHKAQYRADKDLEQTFEMQSTPEHGESNFKARSNLIKAFKETLISPDYAILPPAAQEMELRKLVTENDFNLYASIQANMQANDLTPIALHALKFLLTVNAVNTLPALFNESYFSNIDPESQLFLIALAAIKDTKNLLEMESFSQQFSNLGIKSRGSDLYFSHNSLMLNPKNNLYLSIISDDAHAAQFILEQGQIKLDDPIDDWQASFCHLAVEKGSVQILNLLLEYGASANLQDNTGATPLHFAATLGNAEATAMLLPRCYINIQDAKGRTPLHCAAKLGSLEITKLLQSTNDININARDEKALTPLHFAIKNNHFELVKLLTQNSNIEINAKDNKQRIGLHYAASIGNMEIINCLVNAGADVEAVDKKGKTPLQYAQESLAPEEIIHLLQVQPTQSQAALAGIYGIFRDNKSLAEEQGPGYNPPTQDKKL